jgi:hypothetical protein
VVRPGLDSGWSLDPGLWRRDHSTRPTSALTRATSRYPDVRWP